MSKNFATNMILAAITIAVLYVMVTAAIAGIEHMYAPLNQLHQ